MRQQPAVNGLPEKAIRLARRAAGLQEKGRRRQVVMRLIMAEDGTWYLIVDNGPKIERLGNR